LTTPEHCSIVRTVFGNEGTPVRDRRAEQRERTRREIVAAAWERCRAEGLGGLSLRDLAAAVGMRAPSLYSYFDSKLAIYDAMFAEGCREYLHEVTQLPRTGDTMTDLKATLRHFVGFCTEDHVRHQLLFQRTIPGFEPSPESFAISVQGLDVLATWFHDLGYREPEHLDLATAVASGLAAQQISNDPGGDRWLRLVDDAVEMLVAHFERTVHDHTETTRGEP
jgi:AcrR family transcriptional regulator